MFRERSNTNTKRTTGYTVARVDPWHVSTRSSVHTASPRPPKASGERQAQDATVESPTPNSPLLELGPLDAQRPVVAVSRTEPGVVRQLVEDLRRAVVDQCHRGTVAAVGKSSMSCMPARP